MSKDEIPTLKQKTPKARKRNNQDKGLSLAEMVELEFAIPNVSIGSFNTNEEFEQWINAIQKQAGRNFFKQGKLGVKSDINIDTLLIYLDKYPELFAEQYDEISRDMLKWSLNESIKKHRTMIDKIQEIERELGLAMHHEW